MTDLTGKKIAFAVAKEGIEQVELTSPWEAVKEAGGEPVLVSVEKGQVQAFNHLDKADTFDVDATFADADADAYDGLVLPGGVANPDALRLDEDAVAFIKGVLRQRPARRGDLPRPVVAGGGRRGPRPHADLVAQPPDRPAQRRGAPGRTRRSSSTATW